MPLSLRLLVCGTKPVEKKSFLLYHLYVGTQRPEKCLENSQRTTLKSFREFEPDEKFENILSWKQTEGSNQ